MDIIGAKYVCRVYGFVWIDNIGGNDVHYLFGAYFDQCETSIFNGPAFFLHPYLIFFAPKEMEHLFCTLICSFLHPNTFPSSLPSSVRTISHRRVRPAAPALE